MLEVTRHAQLTDKMVLHFFELPKISEDVNRNDLLLLWLALFKADTDEELQKIEDLGVKELNQAISAYHSVTASQEFLELARLRTKAQHDEAQALYNAEQNKAFSIARNLLEMDFPLDKIVAATGLTRDEIAEIGRR